MTQEGKNVRSIVVFTEQFKALAGRRLTLVIESINALFLTCHRAFPSIVPTLPLWDIPA